MLLAEELLLLLTRKALRKTPPGFGTPAALAAAVLVELAETEQLTLTGDHVAFHHGDGHPLAPALDGAPVEETVMRTGYGLYPVLLGRLTDQGVLTRGSRLGLPMWRLADAPRRDALLAELAAVLVEDVPPTTRTGALIGLAHALKVVRDLVPGMRPAGLFRAAWLARESWPVREFTRTVAACERAGTELPDLMIGDDRWD